MYCIDVVFYVAYDHLKNKIYQKTKKVRKSAITLHNCVRRVVGCEGELLGHFS